MDIYRLFLTEIFLLVDIYGISENMFGYSTKRISIRILVYKYLKMSVKKNKLP